jgi:hypothetical protein
MFPALLLAFSPHASLYWGYAIHPFAATAGPAGRGAACDSRGGWRNAWTDCSAAENRGRNRTRNKGIRYCPQISPVSQAIGRNPRGRYTTKQTQ